MKTKLESYLNEEKMIDEIGKFYVVIKPDKISTLGDIFFEADISRMMLQSRGGLEKEEIYGIYKNKNKAKKIATDLLQSVKGE